MSNNKKETNQAEQKVMTKYDLKMQKRKEQKEKNKKEQRRGNVIAIAVLVAIIALFASFPIHNYMVMNEAYITVGGEEVSKLEFDYHYNVVKNNYMNQNGSYMSYFGVDLTGDLASQMYSETMSWKDYFEQLAVDSITQSKAMEREAAAAGFTYDPTEQFNVFKDAIKVAANETGVSVNNYVQQLYGSYATLGRISDFVKTDIIMNEFYQKKAEENAPTDEAIQEEYENNKDEYESVDFRLTMVNATLPTEPTELADTTAEKPEGAEDTAYVPSQAEIDKAMTDAMILALDAKKVVMTEGELQENVTKANAAYLIEDWLFDNSRATGDTTVITDETNNRYYVVGFVKRYLDITPSADFRVIITEGIDGGEVLNEWQNGAATEESFGELAAMYSVDSSATTGGVYEGVTKSSVPEEIGAWLFDSARASGDTVSIGIDDGAYYYVMYYVGQNDPEWELTIYNNMLMEAMTEYVEGIMSGIEVEDPKGNLNYLKIQALEEAATTQAE